MKIIQKKKYGQPEDVWPIMSRSSLSALANGYKDYDSKPKFAAVNDLRVSGSEVL